MTNPEIESDIQIYANLGRDAVSTEASGPKVELRGIELPAEEKAGIEAEIRTLVEAEIAEHKPVQPEVPMPAPRQPGRRGKLDVSLTGLRLPAEGLGRIERKIQRLAAEAIPTNAASGTGAATAAVSVSSAGWPGQRSFLDGILECPMPPVGKELVIAVYLREDVFRLTVRNGAEENPPLDRNSTTVALSRRQAWDKRITTTQPRPQTIWGIRSVECVNYSTSIRIYDDPYNDPPWTIVFEKPKFLGQWTSMYHWDPYQFMHVFGGKRTRYCWWADNVSSPPSPDFFRTSFEYEYGDPAPTWTSTPDGPGAFINVTSQRCVRNKGDITAGHVGPSMLEYWGYAQGGSTTHAYWRVFDVNIPVGTNTGLQYYIRPMYDLGRFVAVDLICTDGTTLRDSGAVDQNGYSMHPAAGYAGKPLNQWSPIRCHIGRWLAGKTIDRILVAFDRNGSTGWVGGRIDDICIANGVHLPCTPNW